MRPRYLVATMKSKLKISPIPFFFRLFGGWKAIESQVNTWASVNEKASYREIPDFYRFDGWGTVGFPPVVACNVKFRPGTQFECDLGRLVGRR